MKLIRQFVHNGPRLSEDPSLLEARSANEAFPFKIIPGDVVRRNRRSCIIRSCSYLLTGNESIVELVSAERIVVGTVAVWRPDSHVLSRLQSGAPITNQYNIAGKNRVKFIEIKTYSAESSSVFIVTRAR